MNKTLWIILGIVVVVGGYFMMTYNGLVSGSELVDNQWKQVEVQYQRRLDLIPNLVESVKGIMKQETATLALVTDARTKYMNAGTTGAKVAAANELESAVTKLLVVAENYPQLRSVETVLSLQAELAGTENRVAVERMRYNDQVTSYNLMTKRFPSNMIASMFGFEQAVYFAADEGAEVVPTVNF